MENELASKCSVRVDAIRVHRTLLEVSQMKLVGVDLVDLRERVSGAQLVEHEVRWIFFRDGFHRAEKRRRSLWGILPAASAISVGTGGAIVLATHDAHANTLISAALADFEERFAF